MANAVDHYYYPAVALGQPPGLQVRAAILHTKPGLQHIRPGYNRFTPKDGYNYARQKTYFRPQCEKRYTSMFGLMDNRSAVSASDLSTSFYLTPKYTHQSVPGKGNMNNICKQAMFQAMHARDALEMPRPLKSTSRCSAGRSSSDFISSAPSLYYYDALQQQQHPSPSNPTQLNVYEARKKEALDCGDWELYRGPQTREDRASEGCGREVSKTPTLTKGDTLFLNEIKNLLTSTSPKKGILKSSSQSTLDNYGTRPSVPDRSNSPVTPKSPKRVQFEYYASQALSRDRVEPQEVKETPRHLPDGEMSTKSGHDSDDSCPTLSSENDTTEALNNKLRNAVYDRYLWRCQRQSSPASSTASKTSDDIYLDLLNQSFDKQDGRPSPDQGNMDNVQKVDAHSHRDENPRDTPKKEENTGKERTSLHFYIPSEASLHKTISSTTVTLRDVMDRSYVTKNSVCLPPEPRGCRTPDQLKWAHMRADPTSTQTKSHKRFGQVATRADNVYASYSRSTASCQKSTKSRENSGQHHIIRLPRKVKQGYNMKDKKKMINVKLSTDTSKDTQVHKDDRSTVKKKQVTKKSSKSTEDIVLDQLISDQTFPSREGAKMSSLSASTSLQAPLCDSETTHRILRWLSQIEEDPDNQETESDARSQSQEGQQAFEMNTVT